MQWLRACEELCLYRPTLLSVLLLVDSSLPAKEVDLDAAQWFAEHSVPFSVLFTKADKKKAGCPAPRDNIAAFRSGGAAGRLMSCLPGPACVSCHAYICCATACRVRGRRTCNHCSRMHARVRVCVCVCVGGGEATGMAR
jgi:hypothetical protein